MVEETYPCKIICYNCKSENEYEIPKGETIRVFVDYTDKKCLNCDCYLNSERNQ